MSSENPFGADNQQERLNFYIAGYVDGEGSFHVALQRNPSTKLGWQLVPEFRVSQISERRQVLDLISKRLGCGYIKENHRGSSDKTLVLVVRNRNDLLERVIPFFEQHPLLSTKNDDFVKFSTIVKRMAVGEHLDWEKFENLRVIAFSMNGNGRYRRKRRSSESSETICRTPD